MVAEELADIRLAKIIFKAKKCYKKNWFSYHLFLDRDSTLFGSREEESDIDGGLQYIVFIC